MSENCHLTLETLRQACAERLPYFRDARGNLCHSQIDGSDWTANDWMTALVGEVGETANYLKKIRRGDFTLEQVKPEVAKELADALIYLVMLAGQLGIDLTEATVDKFNAVSGKVQAPVVIKPSRLGRDTYGVFLTATDKVS